MYPGSAPQAQYPGSGQPFATGPQQFTPSGPQQYGAMQQQQAGAAGFFPGDRGKTDQLGPPPDLTLQNLMGISVVAWVVFSITALLFGLSYHDSSTEIWTLVILGSSVLFIIITQSWRTSSESPMARVSIIVAAWLLLAVMVGAWVGLFSYDCCIGEYWSAQSLEARFNVLPSEPAGAYGSAGEIVFADEARVDPSKAVGFKDSSTYCVAPIASDAPMDTIQFWAAGTDCCGARGSFVCDDAWNPKAHSAVVIRNTTGQMMGSDMIAKYMKAVQLAEVTYSIASAKEPIFVRWVANPQTVELNVWRYGMGVLLACIIVASLFCGLQAMAIHIAMKRQATQAIGQYRQ